MKIPEYESDLVDRTTVYIPESRRAEFEAGCERVDELSPGGFAMDVVFHDGAHVFILKPKPSRFW